MLASSFSRALMDVTVLSGKMSSMSPKQQQFWSWMRTGWNKSKCHETRHITLIHSYRTVCTCQGTCTHSHLPAGWFDVCRRSKIHFWLLRWFHSRDHCLYSAFCACAPSELCVDVHLFVWTLASFGHGFLPKALSPPKYFQSFGRKLILIHVLDHVLFRNFARRLCLTTQHVLVSCTKPQRSYNADLFLD